MSKKDTGGSAFPVRAWEGPNNQMFWPEQGMTLRDYFAGQALAGAVARTSANPQEHANWAYRRADAMLEERKK